MLKFLPIVILSLCAFAERVPPMKVGGEPVHAFCIKEEAELKESPDHGSKSLGTVTWLEHYLVVEKQKDSQDREWVRVGEFISYNETDPLGWMLKDDLLMRMDAIKKDGIYRKGIVVVYFDNNAGAIQGATVRHAPLEASPSRGQPLTLANIYHIYDVRDDVRSSKTFYLLGDESFIVDPTKPDGTIRGWVSSHRLFSWDSREAAEYDKSTLGQRPGVVIYETMDNLNGVLEGSNVGTTTDPLAVEDETKKEMYYADPRFPIISKQQETGSGHKMWHLGFMADGVRGGPGFRQREEVAQLSKLPNIVDIVIVFDGTGSMEVYKEAVISAVSSIQKAAHDFWEKNYSNEIPADIRFSITMYKDYSEKDHYRRLPLEKNNWKDIKNFLDQHQFDGGRNEPAVFHGISTSLKDTAQEFAPDAFRALFLIGDMGNMGDSLGKADPKGHTTQKIISQLKGSTCDFYAIHVADPAVRDSFARFKEEATTIKNSLAEGRSGYLALTDPGSVKSQIYEKILQLLDERYKLSAVFKDLSTGKLQLGKQITGTILEQRAIEIMKRHGLNPQDFAKKGVSAFAKGWVAPFDPASGQRNMKLVALMNKEEVEMLIALLGQLSRVKEQNVKRGWAKALENALGEQAKFDPEKGVPGAVISKYLGIPVKSGILNMSFEEIGSLPAGKVTEAIKEFQEKLLLLRSVVNEREIQISKDKDGKLTYVPKGDRKFWFGARNNERVWLDMEVYLP